MQIAAGAACFYRSRTGGVSVCMLGFFHGRLSCYIFYWKLPSYQAELQLCARVLRTSVSEIVFLGLPFQLERRQQQTDVLCGERWKEKESRLVRAEQRR